jgi:hypothetical protein
VQGGRRCYRSANGAAGLADSPEVREALVPQPGDRIIVDLGNGCCDVDKITPAGDQVTVRLDLPYHMARDFAIESAGAANGEVWCCHHAQRTLVKRWHH